MSSDNYLDAFVDGTQSMLRELGDEGLAELGPIWFKAYEAAVSAHVGRVVRASVEEFVGNYDEFAQAHGGRGKTNVSSWISGGISLTRFLMMLDFHADGIHSRLRVVFPPRSERFAEATMVTMRYVREQLDQPVQYQLTRDTYECVRRATRLKQWWRARRPGNESQLRSINTRILNETREVTGNLNYPGEDHLPAIVDEWGPAFFICIGHVLGLDERLSHLEEKK